MWGKFSQIHKVHSLFICYKKWLFVPDQSIHGNVQLITMSSYTFNKQQMCSVTLHQFRRRQMWGLFSQFHPLHSFLVCYKKWHVLIEQPIHGNVSTHDNDPLKLRKNKLQMSSVTQHQCRRRQMRGNFSNSPSTLTLYLLQKWHVLTEQSIHGKDSPHEYVFLCYRQTTDVFSHPKSV